MAVQELSRAHIGPTLLTNHIGAGALAHGGLKTVVAVFETRALQPQLQRIGHHRLVQGRLMAQARVGDGLQPRQFITAKLMERLHRRPGHIRHLVFEGRAPAFVQPQARRCLRSARK